MFDEKYGDLLGNYQKPAKRSLTLDCLDNCIDKYKIVYESSRHNLRLIIYILMFDYLIESVTLLTCSRNNGFYVEQNVSNTINVHSYYYISKLNEKKMVCDVH